MPRGLYATAVTLGSRSKVKDRGRHRGDGVDQILETTGRAGAVQVADIRAEAVD